MTQDPTRAEAIRQIRTEAENHRRAGLDALERCPTGAARFKAKRLLRTARALRISADEAAALEPLDLLV